MLKREDNREVPLHGQGDGHVHAGREAGLEHGGGEKKMITVPPEPKADCMAPGTSTGSWSRTHSGGGRRR